MRGRCVSGADMSCSRGESRARSACATITMPAEARRHQTREDGSGAAPYEERRQRRPIEITRDICEHATTSRAVQHAVRARREAELARERAVHPRRAAEAARIGERLGGDVAGGEQAARVLDAEL